MDPLAHGQLDDREILSLVIDEVVAGICVNFTSVRGRALGFEDCGQRTGEVALVSCEFSISEDGWSGCGRRRRGGQGGNSLQDGRPLVGVKSGKESFEVVHGRKENQTLN